MASKSSSAVVAADGEEEPTNLVEGTADGVGEGPPSLREFKVPSIPLLATPRVTSAGPAGQPGAAGSRTHEAEDAASDRDESEGTTPVEGTVPLEGTVDGEDTNDEISTAAAVSASGVLGAWHSGCRGPSPSGAWVV